MPEGELHDLLARLRRASEATERAIAEAAPSGSASGGASGSASSSASGGADTADHAAGEEGPPPAGWQIVGSNPPRPRGGELDALVQLIGALRDLVPPELKQRLADALHDLLMAVRALIDWYLERSETQRAQPTEVKDIPIE